MELFNSLIFILIFGICVATVMIKTEGERLLCFKTLAVFTVLFALFSRIFLFGSVPDGINQDEAMAAVDALSLARYGTDRFGMSLPAHLSAWVYGQMSPLLSYLSAPFVGIFGLNAVSARLCMLLVSLILIFACFFYGETRDKGLLFSFLIAVSPYHIMQSRWALDCNLFPHFFMLGVLFLYLGTKKGTRFYVISMIFFALSMYAYGISIYSVPLFLIASFVYLYKKKMLTKPAIFYLLLVYAVLSLPFFLTMLINFFKIEVFKIGKLTIPYFPYSIRKNDIILFSFSPSQLKENLLCVLRVLFVGTDGLISNAMDGFGILFMFFSPLFILGIYRAIGARKPQNVFMLMFFLTAIFSGLLTNSVNINRLNIIFYPMAYFTALGIYEAVRKAKILGITVIFCFTLGSLVFSYSYFKNYNALSKDAFYAGFGEAVEFAMQSNEEEIYITTNTQSKDSKAVSQILTMFYAKMDKEEYNKSAKEYYQEMWQGKEDKGKYKFIKITEPQGDKNIYVINKEEEKYFSEEMFEITRFKNYRVARKKIS